MSGPYFCCVSGCIFGLVGSIWRWKPSLHLFCPTRPEFLEFQIFFSLEKKLCHFPSSAPMTLCDRLSAVEPLAPAEPSPMAAASPDPTDLASPKVCLRLCVAHSRTGSGPMPPQLAGGICGGEGERAIWTLFKFQWSLFGIPHEPVALRHKIATAHCPTPRSDLKRTLCSVSQKKVNKMYTMDILKIYFLSVWRCTHFVVITTKLTFLKQNILYAWHPTFLDFLLRRYLIGECALMAVQIFNRRPDYNTLPIANLFEFSFPVF